MEVLLAIVAVIGAVVLFNWLTSSDSEPEGKGEEERRRECEEMLKAIADQFGYIARHLVSADELRGLVDEGYDGMQLLVHVAEKIEQTPGLTIGLHRYGEREEPLPRVEVKLLPEWRARHLYAIGKTGTGKSTFLFNLIRQDLRDGRGLALLCPEPELVDRVLRYTPRERWDDVVYVDPTDKEQPVSFNPLQLAPGEEIDRRVADLVGVFRDAFDATGARMLPLLRNSLYALVERDEATLLDLYRLLSPSDASLRQEVISETSNPAVSRFFAEDFPEFPSSARLPLTNRLDGLVSPAGLRGVLCQEEGSFSFREVLQEDKILLFNLSEGELGAENAELLGQLAVARLQQATLSRRGGDPFSVYIDEFQRFTGVASGSYEQMLSRARKYRVEMYLAHQQTRQLPGSLLDEVLGNVGTIVAFQTGAQDARRLTDEFVGENFYGEIETLEPEQILTQGVGEAWTRLPGQILPMYTLPPPEEASIGIGTVKWGEKTKSLSREQYGSSPPEFSPYGRPEASQGPTSFRE